MELIIWILTLYGFTNIVVYGSILDPLRRLINFLAKLPEIYVFPVIFDFIRKMMSCVMCFSTWAGFFMGMFVYSPVSIHIAPVDPYAWVYNILDAFLASGSVWALNTFVEHFEK